MAHGSTQIFRTYKKQNQQLARISLKIIPVVSKYSDWSVVLQAISIEANLTPNRLPIRSPSPENRLARPIKVGVNQVCQTTSSRR